MYEYKILVNPLLQKAWLSGWTKQDDGYREDVYEFPLVDKKLLKESTYVSALLGAVPKAIIQYTNNSQLSNWALINYLSIVCSCFHIMYSVYLFTCVSVDDKSTKDETNKEEEAGGLVII